MTLDQVKQAARRLVEAHQRREPFRPLPAELGPRTAAEGYAIQDAFVALRAQKLGGIAGYKVALTSAEMRRFVGVDAPQAGIMLESTLHRTPARVRTADYLRLIVEFEVAVQIAEDLPAADKPFSRERVAKAVGAVMPAMELADDRNADYSQLAKHPFELIADNCWNEGAVLGLATRTSYATTKAGMLGMARTWALELAPHGITVNVVAPGPIQTDNFHAIVARGSPQVERIAQAIPVKRLGQADDVARAVMFFADRQNGFVTGQVLYVCGGTSVGTLTL